MRPPEAAINYQIFNGAPAQGGVYELFVQIRNRYPAFVIQSDEFRVNRHRAETVGEIQSQPNARDLAQKRLDLWKLGRQALKPVRLIIGGRDANSQLLPSDAEPATDQESRRGIDTRLTFLAGGSNIRTIAKRNRIVEFNILQRQHTVDFDETSGGRKLLDGNDFAERSFVD